MPDQIQPYQQRPSSAGRAESGDCHCPCRHFGCGPLEWQIPRS